MTRDQEIRMTFRSTDADALLIKDAMEKTALAMVEPTEENTSALLELAVGRLALVARRDAA